MSEESSISKLYTNRLGRRKFLKQSVLAVAGTTSLAAFLAACGDNTTTTAANTTAATSATTAASSTTAATSTTAASATTAAGSATTSSGATSAATTGAAAGPTGQSLTVWYNAADDKAYVDVYQRWATKSGNKVNLIALQADGFETAVTTRWAAGERPDILEYHATTGFWVLNPAQNLRELGGEDFVKRAGNLYPTLGTQNGKIYAAVTQAPGSFGILYNKQALANAGVQAPQTFADLAAVCTAIKQKTPNVIPIWESGGSSWPTQILPIMYMSDQNKDDAYAQAVLAKKTTLDDPNGPFVAALTAYTTFLKSGFFNTDITTAKYEDSIKAVAEGKAAMTALAAGVLPLFNAAFGNDPAKTDAAIGFAYPSSKSPVVAWGPALTGTYYLPKTGNANREAAALDFIRYATGEGLQQTVDESKTFPALSGVKEPSGIQPLIAEVNKARLANSALGFNANLVGMNQYFDKTVGSLISGQAQPIDAAKQAQLQLVQGAKANKIPGW